MIMSTPSDSATGELALLAGTRFEDCYQCGKCSAGCPMGQQMDVLPNQLIRLVQLGRVDKAASSSAIWQCVSCLTCSTRCPKNVDCAGIMDALREWSLEHHLAAPDQRRTWLFQREFLNNIRRNGRLNEVELIGVFKMTAFAGDGDMRALVKDSMLAPKLIKRRKFHLVGEKVKDRGVVRRIFERCQRGSRQETTEVGRG